MMGVSRKRKLFEFFQSFQIIQAVVGHSNAAENSEIFHVGHVFQNLQSLIAAIAILDRERGQFGHAGKLGQARIGNSRVLEFQTFQADKALDMLQAGVADHCAAA